MTRSSPVNIASPVNTAVRAWRARSHPVSESRNVWENFTSIVLSTADCTACLQSDRGSNEQLLANRVRSVEATLSEGDAVSDGGRRLGQSLYEKNQELGPQAHGELRGSFLGEVERITKVGLLHPRARIQQFDAELGL